MRWIVLVVVILAVGFWLGRQSVGPADNLQPLIQEADSLRQVIAQHEQEDQQHDQQIQSFADSADTNSARALAAQRRARVAQRRADSSAAATDSALAALRRAGADVTDLALSLHTERQQRADAAAEQAQAYAKKEQEARSLRAQRDLLLIQRNQARIDRAAAVTSLRRITDAVQGGCDVFGIACDRLAITFDYTPSDARPGVTAAYRIKGPIHLGIRWE